MKLVEANIKQGLNVFRRLREVGEKQNLIVFINFLTLRVNTGIVRERLRHRGVTALDSSLGRSILTSFCFLQLLALMELVSSYTFKRSLSQNLPSAFDFHLGHFSGLSLCNKPSSLSLSQELVGIYSSVSLCELFRKFRVFRI